VEDNMNQNEHRMNRAGCRPITRWAGLVIVLAGLAAAEAAGQSQGAKKGTEKPFEEVTLQTRDGVQLRCTYYAGPEKKTTVPLILLHDWDSNRIELHELALFLSQSLNHSVIVPDLRGHGSSVRRQGVAEDIDREKFSRKEVESAMWDVEAAKTFLLQRNNEGKLNIEQLGVVGCGFGATLALHWAVHDWNVRNLPTYKMGQDVKALALISPEWQSRKGMNVAMPLKDQRTLGQLAALFVVGQQEPSRLRDAKRIHGAMEKARTDNHEAALPFYAADTSLQGLRLIYARGLDVPRAIALFLDQQLVQRADQLPWTDRTSPLR
jgi:pimeloyl-ACP methyl ester carboxylesterase